METRTERHAYDRVIAKCSVCGKEGTPGEIKNMRLDTLASILMHQSSLVTVLSTVHVWIVDTVKRKIYMACPSVQFGIY